MGFRFRRSIKLFPGVKINLSKSGPSVSIGPRGAKTTIGPRGARQTIGIPGTGLSYTKAYSNRHYNKSGLETLTVEELKNILRAAGLPVSGRKTALIDRINVALAAEQAEREKQENIERQEKMEKINKENEERLQNMTPEERKKLKTKQRAMLDIFAIIIIGILYFIFS